MKKRLSFGVFAMALTMVLAACGGQAASSSSRKGSSKISSSRPTTSQGPVKSISNLSISLGNEGEKAYITVRGSQTNYTADDFKWAWGLKELNGAFVDGKENPTADDFKAATFDNSNEFTVKYCLTDIATMSAGTLYVIYGGTPEAYNAIPFASNMFGASDATRKYYLRQDQDNALTFDSIQPITYTLASIVELGESDLPTGITQTGAYLKFGGVNNKSLTKDTIDGWHTAGNIAGDFQRVIPENSYSLHVHVDEERFWKIEGDNVFFFLYVGFISEGEGWMVHFDLVSGNQNAGLQTSTTFNGETPYVIDGATYKVFSDRNKSGEENYWGCLGVYREAAQ